MITNIVLGMIYRDDAEILARTLSKYVDTFAYRVVHDYGKDLKQTPFATIPRIARHAVWPDSYAVARNELIKDTRSWYGPHSQWLLMLDADEAMFPDDLESLSKWLETCTADAVYFPRYNFVGPEFRDWLPSLYPDLQTRCIRLGSDVRYINAVHECSAGSKPRVLAPYHIYHYGLCRDPRHVFERRASYERLQGRIPPSEMPAGFADYKEHGPREAFPHAHPLGEKLSEAQVRAA